MANAAARECNPRNRVALLALIGLVIALGLASRRFAFLFPEFLGKYPGDSLWALMVFLGCAFIKPRASTWLLAVTAFGTSCLVEFSQLYQAQWLVTIRATTLGHLVLGSVFSWWDIGAYAVGVGTGFPLDHLLFSSRNHNTCGNPLPKAEEPKHRSRNHQRIQR